VGIARKRFSPEPVITLLREAEVLLKQSNPVAEVCRKLGMSTSIITIRDKRSLLV
jgi:hypothetical protein